MVTIPYEISCAIYEPIEDIEPFERYAAGGYYPVRIGDRFSSSRYHVVHKLGHGSSSTMWLARDERLAKYVAIKFVVSELDRPFESAILRILQDGTGCCAKADAGIAMIPEMLDEFQVEGPEIQGTRRKHHCLVTTPARMSISEARDASYDWLFQSLVARAIAAQLIQAIAFMHSRGVVHAGRYGQPELERITRLDGKPPDQWVPTHGVVPIWLGVGSDTISLADSRIFLSDFGESFQPAVDVRQPSHTPLILRSPELLLELTSCVSFPTEICSLACAVFAILGQRPLFESWFAERDQILDEHVDALGHFPKEWWEN
ncbi:hypothetical protein J1614_000303 [Plenodomus biglobosus]|nr:hypothetical protein J1614_000303 [Plenodomus biglobosus]